MNSIMGLLVANKEDKKVEKLAVMLDVFIDSELCLPTVIYDKAADLRNELIRYLEHIIVTNGNCSYCGKPLSGNRLFLCEECSEKNQPFIKSEEGGSGGKHIEEPTEITYQNCSDALLKMWMDNVLTDAEYNRIMDKLNKAQRKDEPQTERSE